MAEEYLQELFEKMTEENKIKELVVKVFERVQEKTLEQVREKYVGIAVERERRERKLRIGDKELGNGGSRSVEPIGSRVGNEEVMDFLKRMKLEKKERERRQREREQEEQRRRMHYDILKEKQKEEDQARTEEQKQQKLSEMREKSKKRKKEANELLEISKHQYQKVLNSKPLFTKIEENYFRHIKMPELERQKLELAKKRELFQPISRSNILQHARKHDFLIDEHEIQKLGISHDHSYDPTRFRTKFTKAYIEKEKRQKIDREQELLEKKNLVAKKNHYANLVLQMYAPTVDPAKQLELKLIKEKIEETNLAKRRTVQSLSAKDVSTEHEKAKKRKWKVNNMIPPSPPKKELAVIDYLAMQRDKKDNKSPEKPRYEWDPSSSQDLIKKHLNAIENELRKKELRLQVVNPTNLKGVQDSAQVSDLLIDSIKAKIALLEKN